MVPGLIPATLAALGGDKFQHPLLVLVQDSGHGLGGPVGGEDELPSVAPVGDHGVGSHGSPILGEQGLEGLEVGLHLGRPLTAGPLPLGLEVVHLRRQGGVRRQALPIIAKEAEHGGQLRPGGRGRPCSDLVNKFRGEVDPLLRHVIT